MLARALALLTPLFLAALPGASRADFLGRVVQIADGDSITVLMGKRQVKVRLTEIDAPERKQPFGSRSRQSLGDLCAGKDARVVERGTDRYGRTLGRVYCNGVDANAEQVRRGMAWVFDRFVTDRSLYALQDEARAARRGLWADARAIPPWEWRGIKNRSEVHSR
jgi:endonuclease YncB( thermonuclease family)